MGKVFAMKWYRCLIRGENFPGQLIGENLLIGFFVTQFVQDSSPEAAELKVLALLKKHKSLQLPEGVEKPTATKVYFEEIVEVCAEDVPKEQSGFSFYPMDE